jgi:predicted RNA-binding protein YlqC (UPF0109 family)
MITDLVKHVVTGLVEKPEDIIVTEVGEGQKHVVEVKLAKQDLGKVIGKDGQTIRAIRALLHAVHPDVRDIV